MARAKTAKQIAHRISSLKKQVTRLERQRKRAMARDSKKKSSKRRTSSRRRKR